MKALFEDMPLHIQSTLAEDQMSTSSCITTMQSPPMRIYTDRDSLSGVDLNDEAGNLMVYQKALYSGLPPDDNIGRGTGFPAGHCNGRKGGNAP